MSATSLNGIKPESAQPSRSRVQSLNSNRKTAKPERRPKLSGLLPASLLAILLCLSSLTAQDHPLLTRYPGSTVEKEKVEEYADYQLIVGIDPQDELKFLHRDVAGKFTRILYSNPKDRSVLEIMRNYTESLKQSGMQVLFECRNKECGPSFAGSRWNRFNGTVAISGKDVYYSAGRLQTATGVAYIAVSVGKTRSQLDIIEVTDMQQGLVEVNADALLAGIERDGRVSVQGIFFDTAKSSIKPESAAAIEQVALLLKQQPDLKVYVVGHTDNVGSLDANMKLSAARANAVLKELTGKHGIAAARLAAHGVASLAPVQSNQTPEGQAQNRRVELVQQ